MTKEEKQRVYSAYLPYKTNVKTPCGQIRKLAMVDAEEDCVSMTESNGMVPLETVHENGSGFKLILYNLSYLTKEIEHEGELIIPIVEIMKKTSLLDLSECKFDVWEYEENFKNTVYVNAEDKNGRVIDSMYYDMDIFWHMNNNESFSPSNPQREPQEMLLKYGFNVFGLTEDQLINKATLTNK